MLNRRYPKLGIWQRLRQPCLKREKLVRMMDAKDSEILGIYAIGTLFPLDKRERKRLLQLAKHIKWLQRIYSGLWPWGVKL